MERLPPQLIHSPHLALQRERRKEREERRGRGRRRRNQKQRDFYDQSVSVSSPYWSLCMYFRDSLMDLIKKSRRF